MPLQKTPVQTKILPVTVDAWLRSTSKSATNLIDTDITELNVNTKSRNNSVNDERFMLQCRAVRIVAQTQAAALDFPGAALMTIEIHHNFVERPS